MIQWSTYNRQLVKRGEILVSKDLFEAEPEEAKKRPGKPKVYSDTFIIFALIVKSLKGLTYRELQGFLASFFADMNVKVPNFRTIHYRFKKLSQELEKLNIDFDSLPENFVIAIDFTGLKLSK